MIQRVILGAILVSMVASPLNAMQPLRRAAQVGARVTTGQAVRSQQVAGRLVPQVVPVSTQQAAAFSTFNKK